jgi:hypothetical protein
MSSAFIEEAKGMAGFLLSREYKGPGDTIDAAAHRLQRRYGVPSSVIKRLRHREVKDMLLSNFIALASAYQKASQKMEAAYESEKAKATNPKLLRLAAALAGEKEEA